MIVCLGWGSLIWNPGGLKVIGEWQKDGPNVPVEYLRHSQNGRLTLVIDSDVPCSQVLWIKMDCVNIETAKENLRIREGKIKHKYVGFWKEGQNSPKLLPDLDDWAEGVGAEAVIWTALPPKFENIDYKKPNIEDAIAHIERLDVTPKRHAEEYVRKTPAQIRTPFRTKFEEYFNWIEL